MNWLITGGCGFIGVNLIERIFSEDPKAYVRVVDNLQSGCKDMLSGVSDYDEPENIYIDRGKVHLFVEDIKNSVMAMRLCKDIDIVVHLAANTGVPVSVRYPIEDCNTNIFGTLNYLEAARYNKVETFVFASTSAASGGYEPPFHENLFPRPLAPYGASKSAGESYCHVYSTTYGLNTIALRFSNVYGPHSTNKTAQLIPNFIINALNGDVLRIFGDGTQTRDYCYVDDLMDAIMLSIKKAENISGNVIQIATNVETSVEEITNFIKSGLKKLANLTIVKVEYVGERPGDLQRNYSDVSKAENLLGWKSKTDINSGINQTIKWYLKNF